MLEKVEIMAKFVLRNDFFRVFVLLHQLLIMAPALKRISGFDELCHLFITLFGPK